MTSEEIYRHCLETIPADTLGDLVQGEDLPQPWVTVAPDALLGIMTFLRDDPALAFNCLDCLTAIDLLDEGQIEMVYHLYSYIHHHHFVVKSRTGRDEPQMPSVTGLWPAANWYEREEYDMFGVVFGGHPELTRLFLPEEWVGYPMRLDWEESETALGIATTRPDPLIKQKKDVAGSGGGADA